MKSFSKIVKLSIERTNKRFPYLSKEALKQAYYQAVCNDFRYYFKIT